MATSAMSPTKLVLDPNVPELIALKYPTGKVVTSSYGDEKQAYFSLVVAQSINNLQLGTKEPFYICKRWNGSKQQAPRYDVYLTPEGEKARDAIDTPIPASDPPSALEQQLTDSLA